MGTNELEETYSSWGHMGYILSTVSLLAMSGQELEDSLDLSSAHVFRVINGRDDPA